MIQVFFGLKHSMGWTQLFRTKSFLKLERGWMQFFRNGLQIGAALDELTKQLNDDGFNTHSGGVYLHLIPRRSSSLEGKRHVTTVPIKLIRDQNDSHAKQSEFTDHDWVVTAQHKLIPFVFGGIVVQPNGLGKPEAVSYSGPTFIAILSGKHSSSTAYAHALGFERLLQLHEFDTITKYGPDNAVKPVLIITVDGGPDENPRYQEKCIQPFERRMAPLSKELSGLILPHDKYGSHLNDQGLTIDTDLKKKNFAFAGSTLAEIWSQTVVDSHPIVVEYIDPELSELKPETLQSSLVGSTRMY
eukprot:Em0004g1451a